MTEAELDKLCSALQRMEPPLGLAVVTGLQGAGMLPTSLAEHVADVERARAAGAAVPRDIDPETYRSDR